MQIIINLSQIPTVVSILPFMTTELEQPEEKKTHKINPLICVQGTLQLFSD